MDDNCPSMADLPAEEQARMRATRGQPQFAELRDRQKVLRELRNRLNNIADGPATD